MGVELERLEMKIIKEEIKEKLGEFGIKILQIKNRKQNRSIKTDRKITIKK